jgi:DNA polymerase I-like protein with 3'-5' exonuclease and polymerase domains
MRSLYRPLTTTGRLRAQTPPTGVGTNLQNQLRSIRSMFRAPDGMLLCELDYSQAESRLVDGASGDPRALTLARTPPSALDQHRLMASEVLGKAMADVTKAERENVGKRGRHACNYGMEGVRFSEVLIRETEGEVVLTPEECDDIIVRVMEVRPYIATWQAWVRERIIKHRKLVNSYDRHLLFNGRVLSKEDYKEGYAYGPQSDVGQLLTQAGWLPVWRRILREELRTRVVHQGHDAFIMAGPLRELWSLAEMAIESMMVERAYPGVKGAWTLAMPVGMKLGTHWGEAMHEWKEAQLVTWEAFRDVGRAALGETAARARHPRRLSAGAG